MTVGVAVWPGLLTEQEREWLTPGLDREVPRRPDVLVVGGGILGVATGVACVQAGLGSVVVLERDRLGAGASGGAAGLLMPEAHVGVDPPGLVDLARLSLSAWRELESSVPGGLGLVDLDWLGVGDDAAHFGTQLADNTERLSTEQVTRLVPGLALPTPGVFVHRQARVNPLRALARLSTGLPSVSTGVDVQAITVKGGRVATVSTSAGDFEPGVVVFATGTPPRVAGLELNLPAGEVKGHIFATEPTDLRLPGSVASVATSIDDGRLLIGGTLDIGDDERAVRPDVIAGMWAELEAAWPAVHGVRIAHQWACFRPSHPDLVPVVDRIPSLDNAWLTSGHYKTGILMAPATGRMIASWIRSSQRPPEVESLRLDRFPGASEKL